jgi:hypothetical protein
MEPPGDRIDLAAAALGPGLERYRNFGVFFSHVLTAVASYMDRDSGLALLLAASSDASAARHISALVRPGGIPRRDAAADPELEAFERDGGTLLVWNPRSLDAGLVALPLTVMVSAGADIGVVVPQVLAQLAADAGGIRSLASGSPHDREAHSVIRLVHRAARSDAELPPRLRVIQPAPSQLPSNDLLAAMLNPDGSAGEGLNE